MSRYKLGLRWFCLVVGCLLSAGVAKAQTSAGVMTGAVVDASTKKPMADVVVTATSTALQGEETVVTDSSGFYRIPNLPSGIYTLNFDQQAFKPFVRSGIDLRAGSTLRVNAELLPESLKAEEVTVVARAPVVDVGSSSTGTSVTKEFTTRIPVAPPGSKGSASRSFEAVAEVTPGAVPDTFGVSISGASSPENAYVIDGLSVGNPGFGLIGTPLSTEFVKEVSVISGGYMPEYGRSTGGTLNAVTKSGSNEFHGGVFSYFSPGGLEGKRKLVVQAVGTVVGQPTLSYIGDIGADIGGPIVKDKLWFYAGVDFSKQVYNINRSFQRTLVDAMGNPLVGPDGGPVRELIPGSEENWTAEAQQIQAIGKLTYAVDSNNRLTLTVIGTPSTNGGDGKFAVDPRTGKPETESNVFGLNGTFGSIAHQLRGSALDASLKWSSEFSNKHVLIDTMVGWHRESAGVLPSDGTQPGSGQGLAGIPNTVWQRNTPGPHSITDFESISDPSLCDPMRPTNPAICPVPTYTSGGPGFIDTQTFDRYSVGSTVTYLFQALGHHVVKAGVNVELATFDHVKAHSGGVNYNERADQAVIDDVEQFGVLVSPDNPVFLEPLRIQTKSLNAGGFVQDSWSILDKITLNVGVRYDTQQLYAGDGHLGLSLPNQWSPRAGVIWDPSQEGRAKIFANYARYYESVPLSVNDLTLTGEPSVLSSHRYAPAGPGAPAGTCDPTRPPYCQQNASRIKGDPNNQWGPSDPSQLWQTFGAGANPIDPNIQATSSDEIVFGAEYEIVKDARLGLSYTKRWLNEWVEDMSRDNLQTFILGNPGYGIAQDFPKAERNYDALTLYFTKTFGDDWLAQASYTASYLRGNLNGLYKASNNELDPNHNADFDAKSFLINAYGPLSTDHTHDFKIFGARDWALDRQNRFMTGVALRGQSGTPINYYANDVNYGPLINLLLPRGSGGRLPWTYDVDLNLGYRYSVDKDKSFTFTMDIFNLFNFQQVTRVDETYTTSNAVGVQGGTLRDVRKTDIDPVTGLSQPLTSADVNPNFKTPTAYQPPRIFRFGVRGTF